MGGTPFLIPQAGMVEGTDTRIVSRTAGEAIGGNRVVIAGDDGKVYYASRAIPSHRMRVLGITTGAIIQDAVGNIQIFGIMSEVSWNWIMEETIFLSTNGLLTQSVPSSGFVLEMGYPLSSTSMMIRIGVPIVLI